MDKIYNPQDIEKKWSLYWEEHQLSKPTGSGKPYCIMLPPPNVTGTLHMGHGFQQTLMDALIRHKRMQGYRTLWQGGTDHAGIATQMVVEQQLSKAGLSRQDMTREAFIARVWLWREQSGNMITQQMRRLGVSIDWSRERFSMDEGISRATAEAFIKLYHDGLIYRGKRLVNWDTALKTAISDLEIETEEVDGTIWHIRYPITDSDTYLVVATTRPETLFGDTAVAVHPDDERYASFIGKTIQLPLTDRKIPIIADKMVDREFATGCVKITPAHDFNDYHTGKRHQLPLINIMTIDGHLNESAPANYRGLERFTAREKVIEDLKELGLLEKAAPHRLSVPKGERSGTIIEPLLTDQWFVSMSALAKPAIEAVKNGDLAFIPPHWQKIYLQWLENIEDWCISRQLWWGHQLPVWYDDMNNIYVGHNEIEVRKHYQLSQDLPLTQEEDVLDTWFSASLWPFSSLGWPESTKELESFYPTQVLVTGFDIIFFWVARMVMMGLKLTGKIPFHEAYLTGLIRDHHGKKMSKSKGNVLDPIDLIDGIDLESLIKKRTHSLMHPKMAKAIEMETRKEFPKGINAHGTDALRFAFAALATTGRDINFDMGRVEGYRHFCNKIWNAARFVLMHTENQDLNLHQPLVFSVPDRYIQSQLQKLIEAVDTAFNTYRFDLLAQTLYEFIWNEFCDWYLEFVKCTLHDKNANPAQLRGTRITLLEVLETLLRLIHPLMPFISEEIWHAISPLIGKSNHSISNESYPISDSKKIDLVADEDIHWLKAVITAIRTIRSEMGVSPSKPIPIIFNKGTERDEHAIKLLESYIRQLAKVDTLRFAEAGESLNATATQIIQQLEIHIPLANLIDKDAELIRLQKEIDKLEKDYQKIVVKLSNDNYLHKAPKAVVEKERQQFLLVESTIKKLKDQLEHIRAL